MEHAEEESWRQAVAATLRAERAVAGLNQVQVEERTGITRSSYRFYEQGTRMPDAIQLAKIAEAFRIRFSYLMAEIDRRANQ